MLAIAIDGAMIGIFVFMVFFDGVVLFCISPRGIEVCCERDCTPRGNPETAAVAPVTVDTMCELALARDAGPAVRERPTNLFRQEGQVRSNRVRFQRSSSSSGSAPEGSNALTKEARDALLTYFFFFAHPTTASAGTDTAAEGKADLPRPQEQQEGQGKGPPDSSVDVLDGSSKGHKRRWWRVGQEATCARACGDGGDGGGGGGGSGSESSCIVCFGDYADGERLCELPCRHVFHAECINEWLDQAQLPCCPLCKANLLEARVPRKRNGPDVVAGDGTATAARAGEGSGRPRTAGVGSGRPHAAGAGTRAVSTSGWGGSDC
ncbi:unnamed protein product [Pylaiella littoralis]